jgi:hypothetical protein
MFLANRTQPLKHFVEPFHGSYLRGISSVIDVGKKAFNAETVI